MNSFEFNKMAGALLGSLLFLMGLGIFSDALFAPEHAGKPGYALPAAEEGHGAGAAVAATAPAEPLPVLLAKADPKRGETLTKAAQPSRQARTSTGSLAATWARPALPIRMA